MLLGIKKGSSIFKLLINLGLSGLKGGFLSLEKNKSSTAP
jgi:hypothetical protein